MDEVIWTIPAEERAPDLDRLPFANHRPRRLAAWLAKLPMEEPVESADCLVAVLSDLCRLRAEAPLRMTLLELCRPRVRQCRQALDSYLLNLPLSPRGADLDMLYLGVRLHDRLALGYQGVARSALVGRGLPSRQAAAVALQRTLEQLGHGLLLYLLLHRPPEPGLWRRLHRLYAVAEHQGLAAVAVDDLDWPGRETSVAVTYGRLVLLASAQPGGLSRPAVLALYRATAQWARWLTLEPLEGQALFRVDLDSDRPPSCADSGGGFNTRYFDPRPLAAALTRRGGGEAKRLHDHLRWAWEPEPLSRASTQNCG